MSELLKHLQNVAQHIQEIGRPWAVVGALARNEYAGEPRFTSDIDIAIIVKDDKDINLFLNEFCEKGYQVLNASTHPEQNHFTSARVLGLDATHGRFFIDFLFKTTGIEEEVTESAVLTEILPGLTVPLAQKGHYLAMKTLAIASSEREVEKRKTDEADFIAVLRGTTEEDLRLARESVCLINDRYSLPIPDLREKFEALVVEHSAKSEA